MPVSVIDVEVRDQAFQALKQQFDQFQAAVAAQPAAFAALSAQARGVGVAIVAAEATMGGLTAGTELAVSRQRALTQAATQSKGVFALMTGAGDKLAAGIANATRDLKSWASLGNPFERFFGPGGLKNILKSVGQASLLSGLTGVGGLFGLERLGQSVSGQRRSSLGMGVTTGEQNAFRINYGRYTDAEGMLGRVADAKNDVNKQRDFAAIGITPDQLKGMDTAETSRMVMDRTRSMALAHGDNATLQSYAEAFGMTNFQSMDDIRRYMRTPDAEWKESGQHYDRDKGDLSLSDKTTKSWQELDTQLTRAGVKIENILVQGLAPLAEPLAHLSDAFADSLKIFLSNPDFGKWMEQAGHGVEDFAKYVGSDEFKTRIETASKEVAHFGESVGKVATWADKQLVRLGILDPPAGDQGYHFEGLPGLSPAVPNSPGAPPAPWYLRSPQDLLQQISSGSGFNGVPRKSNLSPQLIEKNRRETWDFAKAKGLSDEAAAAMVGNEGGESGFDPGLRGDGGLAGGANQWHKERRDKILAATGIDVWTAPHDKQLEAMYKEMSRGLDAGSARAWAKLHAPISIAGGVSTLVQDHERSANQPADIAKRTAIGEQAYRAYHNAPIAPPTQEGLEASRRKYEDDQRARGIVPFASPFARPPALPPGVQPLPPLSDASDTSAALRAGVTRAAGNRAKPADDPTGTPPAPGYVAANGSARLASNARNGVTIYNQTGGNAVVIAGQAAAVG